MFIREKHTINRILVKADHIIISDAAFVGDMDHITDRVFGHVPCRCNYISRQSGFPKFKDELHIDFSGHIFGLPSVKFEATLSLLFYRKVDLLRKLNF